MIKNYFKTVLRRALKDRLYSIINLLGLSVAIACCIVIFLFVANEFKYDRFHRDANLIYRVTTTENNEGTVRQFSYSYLAVTPLMQSQFAGITTTRLLPQNVSVANKENNVALQEDRFCYVDSGFFEIFSFPLLAGNSKTALDEPHNLLVTESAARKYFGTSDPMGKELILEGTIPFKITGVLKDPPSYSSLQFDLWAPLAAARDIIGPWIANPNSTWHYPPAYCFVKFNSESDYQRAEQGFASFQQKFLPDYITKTRAHAFQAVKDIHFSNLEGELQPTISKSALYILTAAGIVLLLIAAFNFVNLFLARVIFRIRGVGIRKVMGAGNLQVWGQTLAEGLFYLLSATLLALVWVSFFLPAFNSLMDRNLDLFMPETLYVWAWLMMALLATSLIVSIFPSLILSRFKLIDVLKGKSESLFPRKRTLSLQSVFVVLQFAIAVVLIIATVVMQSQMRYIRDKNLGLKKEQVVVLPIRDENVQNNFQVVKNKLLQISGVDEVSAISNFPWENGYYDFETTFSIDGRTAHSNAPTLLVDEDFIKTMGMTMAKGRAFSKEFRTDSSSAFIINEAAAFKFGITHPQNVQLEMESVASGKPKKGELIGIVKDFHLQSLHQSVEPLILTVAPETYYIDNIVLKVSSAGISRTLGLVGDEMKAIAPGRPFEFFFMDEAFDKLYRKEACISSLFNCFAIIAIVIACLGLFGIVAFSAARRLKEIGIRKVLGASVAGIMMLIIKDFLKLVLLAIVIASPIAWWFMNKWIEDFAYRVDIGWWMFAVAGAAALLIALLTVGLQALRSAIVNPVKSLRTE